jgi:hypothetical protein
VRAAFECGWSLGGLPRPEAQVDYYDEQGGHVARADLVVQGAVREYDGREQRLRKDVFTHDRRRQNELVDRGVELRRYTGTDVTAGSAVRLCASVRAAIAAAAARPAPRVTQGPTRCGRHASSRDPRGQTSTPPASRPPDMAMIYAEVPHRRRVGGTMTKIGGQGWRLPLAGSSS